MVASIGEVSERLKEHAWKVCMGRKPIEGSNPSLSATTMQAGVSRYLNELAGVTKAQALVATVRSLPLWFQVLVGGDGVKYRHVQDGLACTGE